VWWQGQHEWSLTITKQPCCGYAGIAVDKKLANSNYQTLFADKVILAIGYYVFFCVLCVTCIEVTCYMYATTTWTTGHVLWVL